ncbi:MAG: hypothetical protein GY805_13850 [Chloroflexi bacterium]|nr:hypothetical protein [Chloroflexota bacterium]
MNQIAHEAHLANGRLHKTILATTLLLYLLLTVAYSIFNPLFEAPDEHYHFFTSNDIVNNGRLPTIPKVYDELLGPEPAQPPLYYLLSALIIAPFDTADAREQVQLNPFAWIGSADAVVNINRTLITEWELWPWQGYALAGHLVRGLSILFGLGTLLCVYGCARLLWPQDGRLALLATALVSFLPQFNFIHAAISNDSLITFLVSAGIWQLLRLWQTGATRRRLLILGITIGLAALSKNAGLLLFFYSFGVLFLLALPQYDSTKGSGIQIRHWLWETAVFFILPVLLIAGWLWWRNQALYGDFTATNQFIAIAGGDRGYTLWQVLAESGGLWLSFFAVFGWFNLLAPTWVYAIWNGLVLLAVAGVVFTAVVKLFQRQRNRDMHKIAHSFTKKKTFIEWVQHLLRQLWVPGWLLAIWFLAVYAGLVTFMRQTEAAQGRLLFPAIVPIVLGLVYGLSRFRSTLIYWLAATAALTTTVASLFLLIMPTYALPKTVAALPPEATPLQETFADGLELVGAQVETETAVPGDIVWYTLYWRLAEPTTAMPAFKFEIFGRDLENPIGEIHTFHGRGLYPPTIWPTGQIIADRFPIRLQTDLDAPVLARGFARLVTQDADETADVELGIFAGSIKISPAIWPVSTAPVLAQLGEDIALTAVTFPTNSVQKGGTLLIDVTWQAKGNPEQDFATLIHLALADQAPLAQGDAHPRSGSYPTRIWVDGEVIEDQYTLIIPSDLPNGCYPLWIGMYQPETFTRLPLTVDGQQQPNDVYQIGEICVR